MPQTYQVKSGDVLSRIAQQYGTDYMTLARASNISDPNKIYPGQTITIPDKVGAGTQPASQPVQQPQVQPQSTGVTPEGIAISSLPPDLVWNGQLDVSNPVKQAKYQQIVGQNRPANNSQPSRVPSVQQAGPATPDLMGFWTKSLDSINTTFQPQLQAAQAEQAAIQKEVDTRTQAYNAALGKINDNPYYSEATRVGRAAKLQQAYNNDIQAINGRLTNAQNKGLTVQNQIDRAKADAQVNMNIQTQQYNIDNAKFQQNLQILNNGLTQGLFNNASSADIAQIALATGLSTSMVQSVITESKKSKEVKPTLQSVSDSTGQYIYAVSYDAKGNPVVSAKQKVGEATPTTPSAATSLKGNISTMQNYLKQNTRTQGADGVGKVDSNIWNDAKSKWIQAGNSAKEFDDNFSYLINKPWKSQYNLNPS